MSVYTSSQNLNLPRPITPRVKRAILFSSPRSWIGLIFFLVGTVMILIFIPMSDMNFSNPLDTAPVLTTGVITTIEETSASENKRKIHRYDYRYLAEGQTLNGSSYHPGKLYLQSGDSVYVEYQAGNPSFSRIQNFRMAPFLGETVLFMLVFPVVGLILLIVSVFKARKNIALVRNGYLTTGKVTGKEATATRINKRRVYKVFFDYTGYDGVQRQGVVRTHEPERLEDDEKEQLLFNPDRPEEALLLDALPKAVRRFFAGGHQ